MNRSLLLNGLILGTLLCTGTITARAVDADVQSGIAAAAPRETRAQAVHSTWRDRTDIAVGVQTGSAHLKDMKAFFLQMTTISSIVKKRITGI